MPRRKDTAWMEWHSIETVSGLSEDEIADLEDEVIHLISAGADLVPPHSLSTLADVGHI